MTRTTMGRAKSLICVAGLAFGGILLFAGTDWSKKDASTWTDEDVRAILSNSPWAKQSKLSSGQSSDSGYGNGGGRMGGGNGGGNGGGIGGGGIGGGGMGGGMGGGGMGGGGMGGGGMGGGGRGMGGNRGGMGQGGDRQPDVEVTVQWYSAKPVRLATQKRQNADAKATPLEPLDHYIIAVTGFPSGSGYRRRGDADEGADQNSDSQTGEMSESMQNRLKDGAMLSRKGHDPIHPDKAAWDNSTGTRTLMLYFPKTDAITAPDKDVEVQVAMGRMQVKKKFALKDMNYDGNLEL